MPLSPEDKLRLLEAMAFMEKAGAMLGRGEMPSAGTPYAVEWHAAHATLLSALKALLNAARAQGPTGGGEPVAWRVWQIASDGWFVLNAPSEAEKCKSSGHKVEPLYTHPADDKLAVAVEALKSFPDRGDFSGPDRFGEYVEDWWQEKAAPALALLTAKDQEGGL